jgi:hypothetical protein
MQPSHDLAAADAVFDEANLVSCAGLAPVLALAEQAGLSGLLVEQLTVASPNAPVKVTALLAGMLAASPALRPLCASGARGRTRAAGRGKTITATQGDSDQRTDGHALSAAVFSGHRRCVKGA